MKGIFFCIFGLIATAAIAQEEAPVCNVYSPNENDVIIMDMEQRGPGGGWEWMNNLPGYGGSGYLTYKPNSNFGGAEPKPQNLEEPRIKTFFFKVKTPGSYRVLIRSAAPDFTEHNDIFMSLPESGAVQRRFNMESDLTYPTDPNGENFSPNNWFKVYQNKGNLEWHVGGVHVDFEGHVIITRPLVPGPWYSVRICGRSTKFNLDRITLYPCEGEECNDGSPKFNYAAYNENLSQSYCGAE